MIVRSYRRVVVESASFRFMRSSVPCDEASTVVEVRATQAGSRRGPVYLPADRESGVRFLRAYDALRREPVAARTVTYPEQRIAVAEVASIEGDTSRGPLVMRRRSDAPGVVEVASRDGSIELPTDDAGADGFCRAYHRVLGEDVEYRVEAVP